MMIFGLSGQPFSDYKGVFLFGFLGGICYHSKFLSHIPSLRGEALKIMQPPQTKL